MRKITTHQDMNPDMFVDVFAVDPPHPVSNGCHHYELEISGELVGDLKFQNGPPNVEGSIPGVLEPALLAVVIDRLHGFQAGPFGCRENALVLTHLEEALLWMDRRVADRRARNVLGHNKK